MFLFRLAQIFFFSFSFSAGRPFFFLVQSLAFSFLVQVFSFSRKRKEVQGKGFEPSNP